MLLIVSFSASSAAKAVAEGKPVIAAVNRCATQKQNRVSAGCKAAVDLCGTYGAANLP
ncbi:MAG: hypothetical protein WA383_13340 [Terriglobales bacterium]